MVLESFSQGRILEIKACELLGIKISRLYQLKNRWIQCIEEGKVFTLWARERDDFHRFSQEVEAWLDKQLRYIRYEAKF